MSDDYLVKGRSNLELRKIAAQTHSYFGLRKDWQVDIIACLRRGQVMTLSGEKPLNFEVVPDHEMGLNDGLTSYASSAITIRARKTVNDHARLGVGRPRMTLAHELGHAVMHPGAPKARRALGNNVHEFIPAYQSAEHQAKVFASEFLIPESETGKFQSPKDLAVHFGVSLEAAEYRFKDPTEQIRRAEGAAKLNKLADELRTNSDNTRHVNHFLDQHCATCGHATLIPIGVKYLCQTCDTVTDQFQDGDRL
ncbi:MAG: ImmA/IrrE family metallo-endopeptidase [Hyphomicrobiales bacterium]|nr:ImmA/IrrE family metallo-endopeptidase [Hyphomicrobiales bacterium]